VYGVIYGRKCSEGLNDRVKVEGGRQRVRDVKKYPRLKVYKGTRSPTQTMSIIILTI
jgi:hypothetical protein